MTTFALVDARSNVVHRISRVRAFAPEAGYLAAQSDAPLAPGMLYDPATTTFAVAAAPIPSVADLLALASDRQNQVLAQTWAFEVGFSDAPLWVTTKLDPDGDRAMLKILAWSQANADVADAILPYSNVDFTAANLTPASAARLVSQAGAIEQTTYAVLNELSGAILASPPTIVETAAIAVAAWPSPAAAPSA